MKIINNTFYAKTIIAPFIMLLFMSCATKQEIAYFQDEPLSSYQKIEFDTDIIYKSSDKLSIIVSSSEPLATMPFNLPTIAQGRSEIITQSTVKMQTYLVNMDGTVDFPVLGILKIGGLTRTQATAMLKEKLKEYLKDPIVNIRLINFTITILGEVRNPGTFTIEDEKISITQALGLAGDLTIHGKRENVLLIRENNGQKKYAQLDLTSVSVLNSSTYYMQQDDVIYVSPNRAKVRSSTFNPNTVIIISAITALTAITALIIK